MRPLLRFSPVAVEGPHGAPGWCSLPNIPLLSTRPDPTRPTSPHPQERGIQLPELPETGWDEPLGSGSGAAVVFGTTGGVMEAALRTVGRLLVGAVGHTIVGLSSRSVRLG